MPEGMSSRVTVVEEPVAEAVAQLISTLFGSNLFNEEKTHKQEP